MTTTRHPDGLYCPVCGCGSIPWWPELEDWETMGDEEKVKFEICPCCDFGSDEFPYEEFQIEQPGGVAESGL